MNSFKSAKNVEQLLSAMAKASSHKFALSPVKCWQCRNDLTPHHNRLCRNGHTICGPCANGLNRCSQCNVNYLPDDSNVKINEIMLRPCEHRENGCLRFIVSKDIISHVIACSYRTIRCRVFEGYACEWSGTYMKLYPHITKDHRVAIQATSNNFKVSWNEGMPEKAVMIVRVFGKRFYLFRETSSSAITWAFQFIGQYSDNRKYRYQMKVFSDNLLIQSITSPTMEVHDIRDCFEDMVDSCCMYTKTAINRFKAANDAQFEIVVTNI